VTNSSASVETVFLTAAVRTEPLLTGIGKERTLEASPSFARCNVPNTGCLLHVSRLRRLSNSPPMFYREWSGKVDVLRAPKDEEWGARTFDLLDPSGYTIFVMGPARKGTAILNKNADLDCSRPAP
jgi:hypothetical protein